MKNKKPFKNPFHPGQILLEEFLMPNRETLSSFANKLGWTKAKLGEFIKGKRGITAESSLDLAEALGTTGKIWLKLQASFDLHKAQLSRRKKAS